jgi:hypothetical protein
MRHPLRFPFQANGRCSFCVGNAAGRGLAFVKCLNTDCRQVFCDICDQVHPCDKCGIPVCWECRRNHCNAKVVDQDFYNSWTPPSFSCPSCQAWIGFSTYDCEACGLRQCENLRCVSQLMTTDCCLRDCCKVCTFTISAREAIKRCTLSAFGARKEKVRVCYICFHNTATFNHSKCVAPCTAG